MKKLFVLAALFGLFMVPTAYSAESGPTFWSKFEVSGRVGQHWNAPELDKIADQRPLTFVSVKPEYHWSPTSHFSLGSEVKRYINDRAERPWDVELAVEVRF